MVWRHCKNPLHHIHPRAAENKFVVQFSYNKKRISQYFDNLQDAIEWRDQQLKAFQRPIYTIAPPLIAVPPAQPRAPRALEVEQRKPKMAKATQFTDIMPVLGPGKIVSFD